MKKIPRRSFLYLSGIAGAAVSAAGCSNTVEKLIPYLNQPSYPKPGEWAYLATSCRECPAGCGMLLSYRDGRVTKAEGNPVHPVNRGKLCARGQSSLQGLYDPNRIKNVYYRRSKEEKIKSDWEEAITKISEKLKSANRVKIISDLQTGSLSQVFKDLASRFNSEVIYYEAFNYENLRQAHQTVFNLPVIPRYNLANADFILSLGADFLETWISPVEFALQFNEMHSYKNKKIGTFIYSGSRFSMTAANADHYIQLNPHDRKQFIFLLLDKIINSKAVKKSIPGLKEQVSNLLYSGTSNNHLEEHVNKTYKYILNSKAPIVLAGPNGINNQTEYEIAVAAACINYLLGAADSLMDFSNPHALTTTALNKETQSFFSELNEDDLLIVHNTNPSYQNKCFAEGIKKAGCVVYMGTNENETSAFADWILPIDYYLEEWGDYEPYSETLNTIQPVISRLYDTHSAGEILLALSEAAGTPALQKEYDNYEMYVKENVVPDGLSTEEIFSKGGFFMERNQKTGSENPPLSINELSFNTKSEKKDNEFFLVTWPSIFLFDGRYFDRGWLNEAPEPVSYIAWQQWIEINPADAEKLDIEENELVELTSSYGEIKSPVRVTTDVSIGCVSVPLGYNHKKNGYNDTNSNPFFLAGSRNQETFVTIKKTGDEKKLVYLSATQDQHNRDVLKWIALKELTGMKPGDGEDLILPLPEGYDINRDLYPPHEHKNHRWAMSIDLQSCIGCGACSVACYAENNIPVVGEEACMQGYEQAWLKIVPYRKEKDNTAEVQKLGWLPMLCQHCDSAPCEAVCPVFAAVHNEEGLNAQIYNRCIGTRYCSNNCPYKVRRFNWSTPEWEEPLQLQLNPEVTVRTRGVMEKCTFCVQRIRNVEYKAKINRKEIKDGDVVPACAQTCPTEAIVFGDLLDKSSRVYSDTTGNPRRYHLLEELNTKPAVTYLKRINKDE